MTWSDAYDIGCTVLGLLLIGAGLLVGVLWVCVRCA